MQQTLLVSYKDVVTKQKEVTITEESPIPKWCADDKTCCVCEWKLNEDNNPYVMALKTNCGVFYRHINCHIPIKG